MFEFYTYCHHFTTYLHECLKKSLLFIVVFEIERNPEHGGNLSFSDFDSLEQAFAKEVSL